MPQWVTIDGSAHMMNLLMTLKQGGGMVNERGNSLLDGAHFSRCYETKDHRHISVQCLEPQFYAAFLEKLSLSNDKEFTEQFNRSLWPVQSKRLQSIISTKTAEQWESIFAGTDACVATVMSPEQALHHPMLKERGVWFENDGVLQSASAPRFSTGPAWKAKASPKRDEHRLEILNELNQHGN